MSETVQPAPLLDLAIPRKIRLHDRGRAFTISCRRVEPADWRAFFDSLTVTSEQQGKERVTTNDSVTPILKLAESVIIGAEGYKAEGGVDLTTLTAWQSRLPLAHRHRVGLTLSDARVSKLDEDFIIRPEGEEVSIDATWSLDEVTGNMVAFRGLKHFFKTPTVAQHKRYNQASSRSVVVGGSRTGRTIYAGAQETVCELYDELIVRVDGYSVNGKLLDGKTDICNWMDLNHKFVAAEQLFNPAAVTTEADAE